MARGSATTSRIAIRGADEVLVLCDEDVVESGVHIEMLSAGGCCTELHSFWLDEGAQGERA